jgi:hypothetical protein
MKLVLLGAAAAAVLSGCAAPLTPARATEIVQNSPEWELCYVAIRGGGNQVLRSAVYEDIARRRIDCNQHMPMVMARMQQDGIDRANANAQAQLGLQLMNAGRARPATPMSPQVVCRSVNMGTYVRTVCD